MSKWNTKFDNGEDPDEDDENYKPVRWYHVVIVIGIFALLAFLAKHLIWI